MAKISFPPLHTATFEQRLNRFVGEVSINDARLKVHIASSGRMVDLLVPGAQALIRLAPESSPRSTAGTLVAIRQQGLWVSVDATLPNRLVEKALQQLIHELADYQLESREYTVGHSRFDFLLTSGGSP